jgi:protein-L-isoaspartate(D-aspartate) O-methyltransferase
MNPRLFGAGMTSRRTRLKLIGELREQGITDEEVLSAMSAIPRHIFVEEALSSRAYDDIPLPIGFGQTISSPYIVARMSELLRAGEKLGRVLEIGTGCGYQTAVLARLCGEVYSIERIRALLERARVTLRELRLQNVRFKHGDGLLGLPDEAPFDGIIVTGAMNRVSGTLLSQLKEGGRIVLPKGSSEQVLCVTQKKRGGWDEKALEHVKFVPILPGVE